MDMLDLVISVLTSIASVAIGYFGYKMLHHLYGKLELERKAIITPPIKLGTGEIHYYIKLQVKNKSRKAFLKVRPIVKLEGEGVADYIHGNPHYKISTDGILCWGGLNGSERDIYPQDETNYIDLFRIVIPRDPSYRPRIEMPSEGSWREPRSLMVCVNNEPLESKSSIAWDLFKQLDWRAKLILLPRNGRKLEYELDLERMKRAMEKAEHKKFLLEPFEIVNPGN